MERDFIMLPIFYHTSESNRIEDMGSDLGIDIMPSIDDYEVRLTRVNVNAIGFYYPMNFLGNDVCGMFIDGIETTLAITSEQADKIVIPPRAVYTVVDKKVKIKLTDWDHECGDGCCTDYGVEIEVDGVTCDDSNAGDSVEQAVGFVLKELGIDFEFV